MCFYIRQHGLIRQTKVYEMQIFFRYDATVNYRQQFKHQLAQENLGQVGTENIALEAKLST